MQSTNIVEGFRLSPQQRRLWKLQQDTAGDLRFAAQLVLLLEGEVQADALREALEKVCTRHQALRCTFRRLPGVVLPVQTISDQVALSWKAVAVSDEPESIVEEFDYEN